MRLIDADTLKAAINRYADDAEAAAIIETGGSAMAWEYRQVLQSACALKLSLKIVDEMPTADAVEVVHCKDCHWNDRDGRCVNPKCGKSWYGCPVPDNHFCSYGEPRKEAAQDEKSDRERLMQLLQEARTKHLMKEVVDYLIANGVTFDRET